MQGNNPDRWHFTVQNNANGFAYVYAYQTAWDPVTKRSRRVAKKYVGRLLEDGRVTISPKFAALFPEYAQGDFYYGAEKTLVSRAEYLADYPREPEPAPEEEACESEGSVRALGLTWAAENIALQSGLLHDLEATFGREAGRDLLNLALYKLDGGLTRAGFGGWASQAWLSCGEPLSEERIGERLAEVEPEAFLRFFQKRRERHLAQGKAPRERRLYAIDNTFISASSHTISDAACGHPGLCELHYTFVCDRATGDVVFAHAYEGAVSDDVALQEILYRLHSAGFDLDDVLLVTDRDNESIGNVQRTQEPSLRFVKGVRIAEDPVEKLLVSRRESLTDMAFYRASVNAYAVSAKEPGAGNRGLGASQKDVYVHLYRFPLADESARIELVRKVESALTLKNDGKEVPPALWETCKRFIKPIEENGAVRWRSDVAALEEACRYAGIFALRSDEIADPYEALRIYGLRNALATDFNQLQNGGDGDRLRHSRSADVGKLLITTLAVALRAMMRHRAHRATQAGHDALDDALGMLRGLFAEKRRGAQAWVSRTPTKKQRDCLALLGVPLPPRVLR